MLHLATMASRKERGWRLGGLDSQRHVRGCYLILSLFLGLIASNVKRSREKFTPYTLQHVKGDTLKEIIEEVIYGMNAAENVIEQLNSSPED